jgi:hypothetical protein
VRSARQLLIDWANQQDMWVRALVGDVLARRRELDPAGVQRASTLFRAEKCLSGEAPPAGIDLGDDAAGEDEPGRLVLRSIDDCSGVNALSPGQRIPFNQHLTLVYGENASGKTGYVRIVKSAAGVRKAEPIIPDIHRVSAPSTPRALITYALDDREATYHWRGMSDPTFSRIAIFDSGAVDIHLAPDLTYVFTPRELALFRYTHTSIDAVRAALENEVANTRPRGNPFLSAFSRGTTIYPLIETLGPTTDIRGLEELGALTAEEHAELDALAASIEGLATAGGDVAVAVFSNRATVLGHLMTLANAAITFDAAAHAAAVGEEAEARRLHEEVAARVTAHLALTANERPSWQEFVEAADRYVAAMRRDDYPAQGDACIFCRQPLGDEAQARIHAYREFASGASARRADAAHRTAAEAAIALVGAPVTDALAALSTLLAGVTSGEARSAWAGLAHRLVDAVKQAQAQLSAGATVAEAESLRALGREAVPIFRTVAAETATTIQGMRASETERAALLDRDRTRRASLEARKTLGRLLPDIRAHVNRATYAARLETFLQRFQGLLRGLTEVAKAASSEMLNGNFERYFDQECRALRAPTVRLDFPGRRGQAARRKTVGVEHPLDRILSEGEQKVIALADFLAEARLRAGSAPIVFDDPVSSLDHKRLAEVVDRIVALSAEHQVIVFTHDVWFVAQILDELAKTPEAVTILDVLDHGGLKGIVRPTTYPRFERLAAIKGRINVGIQAAEHASLGDEQEKAVRETWGHVRSWCEMIVEQELFHGVFQRLRPNIAMTNLANINFDRLAAAVEVVHATFEKACRHTYAHSQPMDVVSVRPTVAELREDWERLQDAVKAYSSK